MKPKLYIFGCSYCTGDELLIHKIEDLNEYRLKTSHDPRKFFKELEKLNLQSLYEDIKIQQKKNSWPQQLADKMNYECVNLSESGNSLDKMLYQFLENSKNISKKDLIIVSLTKASRNAYFNKSVESFQLPSCSWPIKSLMGVSDNGNVKSVINKKTDLALLDWFTDDRIVWDFIKNIKIFESFKSEYNLYIIPTMENRIETNFSVLTELWQSLKENFLTDKSLDYFTSKRLPWGHPDKSAHENYADHLYEILRKL